MKNTRIIVILLFAFFSACTSPVTEVKLVQTWHDDQYTLLKEEFEVLKDQLDVKSGPYKRFSEDGILLEKAFYKDNSLHGERRLFYPDGKLFIIEQHEEGDFQGPYFSFFNNGNIMEEGYFENNNIHGVWKNFYESGGNNEIVTFEHGEENGPFEKYHENGQLAAKGQYNNTREDGKWLFYHENGNLKEEVNFIDGWEEGLVKVYDEDGNLWKEITYLGGRVVEYNEYEL